GALFTDDSDYVSYAGTIPRGRPRHEHNHDLLFRGGRAGSALVGELEPIRSVTPGLAVVRGTAPPLSPGPGRRPKRLPSRQTTVLVRPSAGWRISAIHTGRVRPVGIPAPDSFPSRMSRLLTRLFGRR